MMLLLGSWILVSIVLILAWVILGWWIGSATDGGRDASQTRHAFSRVQRFGLLGVFTTLTGKLFIGGVAFATVGGLAVEGALPKPVQDAVSAVAERVGVKIPSSEDGDDVRPASPEESETRVVVRRRVLSVIDNWDGDRDCEYLHALAQAAGATSPGRCPGANGEGGKRVNGSGSESSELVPHPMPPQQPPPVDPPPVDPPPVDPPPDQPPPVDPPPVDPPPVDPPPVDPPPVDPPPVDPPPADPPPAEWPPAEWPGPEPP